MSGEDLAIQYEALRGRALGGIEGPGGLGWGLFVRLGMAAWMEDGSMTPRLAEGEVHKETRPVVGLIPPARDELVMALASMAWHHVEENADGT